MPFLKLLFICSQNKIRSLTAEKIFEGFPGYSVRSAGTESNARVRVTKGHLGWADLIFVMEKRHQARLKSKFPDAIAHKSVICLHILDDYEYMDDDLIEVLKAKLSEYINLPD